MKLRGVIHRPSCEAMLFTSGTECAIVPRVSCFLKRDKEKSQLRKFKQSCTCAVYMVTVISSFANQEFLFADRLGVTASVEYNLFGKKGEFEGRSYGSQPLEFLYNLKEQGRGLLLFYPWRDLHSKLALIKDECGVLLTDKFYSEKARLWHRVRRRFAILLDEKINYLYFPSNFMLNIFYFYKLLAMFNIPHES